MKQLSTPFTLRLTIEADSYMANPCFQDVCSCSCNEYESIFDDTINAELSNGKSITEICHSNIGWFNDKTMDNEHFLKDWFTRRTNGIYFLWHKDDYCTKHILFHMKCLYIGKGDIKKRITNHFNSKDFSEEMLVYFSWVEMNNRLSKYYEQLFLDIYNVPNNKNENNGTKKLCMHFSQSEVD